MDNMNVAPINHGVLSATGNVAAGAGIGAVKTGLKAIGGWVAALAVIGAGIGFFSVTGPIAVAFAMIGGGLLGGGLGLWTSSFAGVIGATLGAFTGGAKAIDRVGAEKGAANVMQAQVEAYKAQAYMAAVNDNKYNFPAQGSAMNQAGSNISAMQAEGRVDGQQLQRA